MPYSIYDHPQAHFSDQKILFRDQSAKQGIFWGCQMHFTLKSNTMDLGTRSNYKWTEFHWQNYITRTILLSNLVSVVCKIFSECFIICKVWQCSLFLPSFVKQVSLSSKAEHVLEERIQNETNGDVLYFWAPLAMDGRVTGSNVLTFWSMCDILNGGNCR